jgi:hypothetical protein
MSRFFTRRVEAVFQAKREESHFAGDKDSLIATRGPPSAFFSSNCAGQRQKSVDGPGQRLIRMNVSTIDICTGPQQSFTTMRRAAMQDPPGLIS